MKNKIYPGFRVYSGKDMAEKLREEDKEILYPEGEEQEPPRRDRLDGLQCLSNLYKMDRWATTLSDRNLYMVYGECFSEQRAFFIYLLLREAVLRGKTVYVLSKDFSELDFARELVCFLSERAYYDWEWKKEGSAPPDLFDSEDRAAFHEALAVLEKLPIFFCRDHFGPEETGRMMKWIPPHARIFVDDLSLLQTSRRKGTVRHRARQMKVWAEQRNIAVVGVVQIPVSIIGNPSCNYTFFEKTAGTADTEFLLEWANPYYPDRDGFIAVTISEIGENNRKGVAWWNDRRGMLHF